MILEDELIGLSVTVSKSTDKSKRGVFGRVVNETKNTLTIDTKDGEKKIPKAECSFEFLYQGEPVKVEGKLLVSRPEDRIKKSRHWSRKWRLPKLFFK
ncbi:MAG: ribonuclease P protein component 1 [Candidatus Altiarchaeota archaeon]|nr:ribonuclease P protein component 1 [Candidatus Altiarchaeota archaeon]